MASNNNNVAVVSREQRIKELNQIDHQIAEILSSASTAIGLLTNEGYDEPNPKVADVKAQIQSASATYFSTLSEIEVHLRRQVYALDEAGLIVKGSTYDASRATSMNEDQTSKRGGGGPLDSSWLNARAKDSIGQGLKRELLNEAQVFLKKNNIKSDDATGNDMQVDSDDGPDVLDL